jgi:hypothetical protein
MTRQANNAVNVGYRDANVGRDAANSMAQLPS